MKNRIKWSLVTCMLVAVGFLNGCGSDNNYSSSPTTTTTLPPQKTASAPVTVTVSSDGSSATTGATAATVAAPATASAALKPITVTLPPATIITAKDAAGKPVTLTTAPTFTFQAPADATDKFSGTPPSELNIKSASVLIDVQITGSTSSTFSNPITIVLPAPGKAAGSTVEKVYKINGGIRTEVGGPYTVSSSGTISVTVSGLSLFVGDGIPLTTTTTIPVTSTTTTTIPGTSTTTTTKPVTTTTTTTIPKTGSTGSTN